MATISDTRAMMTVLSDTDRLRLFAVMMSESDSVQRWIADGSPSQDIDCIHAKNAIQSLRYKPSYQKVRDDLLKVYDLDEEAMVRQVLHGAARHDEPKLTSTPRRR